MRIKTDKDIYDALQKNKMALLNKKIPCQYPKDMAKVMQPFKGKFYIDKFDLINISSFVPVSANWVKPLSAFIGDKKCLEIMAGKGVLSKALSDYGTDIRATDDYSWRWHRNRQNKDGEGLKREELWHNVEQLDCVESVSRYGRAVDFIICCCPPFGSDSLYCALLKMRKLNPNCMLIYIGEGKGGCHGEARFFNEAKFIRDNTAFNHAASLYQSWPLVYETVNLVV